MTRRHSALLLLALPAFASGNADICYGPVHAATASQPPVAATVFTCPRAGNAPIATLAAAGWRVTQLDEVIVGNAGGVQQSAARLLIVRADRVFGSGFE